MTTRWKQKFSVALAIIAVLSLLLMLILLWSAVSNGMLATSQDNVNITMKNHPEATTQHPWRQQDYPGSTTLKDSVEDASKDYIHEEFIKPSKVHHLSLHTDDLLYESKRNNTIRDDYFQVHKITGNYRSKSSQIWDPHPEYILTAFGRNMHLVLYQDTSFVPSTFKITNDYGNETEIRENYINLGCHYKGRVLNDESSAVAVSLCNGMTGHIKTSYGSFFIEPVSENIEQDSEIIHRIWRQSMRHSDADLHGHQDHNCPIHDHSPNNKGFEFRSHSTNNSLNSRRKRSIVGEHEFTLEVLIAVDNKMIEFHGRETDSYILTLMSIVSNIFSDATIGNSINVAVVKILKIKNGLNVKHIDQGVYATDLLKNFCNYLQPKKYRYDTALLITREQICRNATETRCDTLGLAELGTVCKDYSCSIVQDNGLSAAFTIAHELGHILNMPHDDDKKCNRFKRNGRHVLNIMSSTMGNDIHPWSWSDCSRHYVTEFLESDNKYCMINSADTPYPIGGKKLPGEIYDLNQQCELIHGFGARHCNYNEKECGRLLCQEDNDINGCRSSNLPWADGTPCIDDDHWCQKGECLRRDRKMLTPIHGGWGPWSEFTPCSRTCGGGVQESQRECNHPVPQYGGRYCIGNRKEYRACNPQNCPPDTPDFREIQCSELNNNNFNIEGIDRNVKWIPKYGVSPKDECKLFCRVEKSPNYFQLVEKVKDGTTCSFDSYNKCVNGICKPAGCDNVIFSSAKLDRCGVCEGNNNTCHEVREHFYNSDRKQGRQHPKWKFYFDVVRIPKGASNIEIIQPGYRETNYIVLLDDQNEYLLNGNITIHTFKKIFPYAGVTFEYTGANTSLERINTTYSRKIKRDLFVQILSLPQDNQNSNEILLTYSYTMDNHDYYSHHPRKKIYRWDLDLWSPCSAICQGERSRNVVCMDMETGQKVSSSLCDVMQKPSGALYQTCNLECELMVNETGTTECSAKCGKLGTRKKFFACVQKDLVNNLSKYVDMSHCEGKFKNIQKYEECREPCWNYTEWSPCSKTCGGGDQTRSVVCISNDGIVPDYMCNHSKRQEFGDVIRPCNTDECPSPSLSEHQHIKRRPYKSVYTYQSTIPIKNVNSVFTANQLDMAGNAWAMGQWSACDDNCERTRSVYCKNTSHPDYCPDSAKPQSVVKCCHIRYVQIWSQCSVKCGIGKKTKEIICARVTRSDRKDGKNIKIQIDPEKCKNLPRPRPKLLEKPCRNACSWITGQWSTCTTNKTNEYTTRTINCTRKDQLIPNEYCDQRKKPVSRRPCPSSQQIRVDWSNCSCDGYKHQKVTCYEGANKRIPCQRKHKSRKAKCKPPEECILKSCLHVREYKNTMQDGQYLINVRQKVMRIYCHNMTSSKPLEYITLHSVENYSIYYDKRALNTRTCPNGSTRNEFEDKSIESGYTQFKKIRLDIRSLKVIEDDYTFAESQGFPQKLGSAGDCYNQNMQCPQGFFSINLKGTGFRISASTQWDTYGGYTSMKFLHELRHPFTFVQAYCGGYCGSCFVSKNTSLVLDVI